MIAEKDRLEEFADALRDKLNYFDQLEKVAEQFQAGAIISAASDASGSEVAPREQILPMLKRLDDCLEFVASNPQYATSGSYGTKFKQLQTRAMSTVREYFVSALRKATKNVQDAAKGKRARAVSTTKSSSRRGVRPRCCMCDSARGRSSCVISRRNSKSEGITRSTPRCCPIVTSCIASNARRYSRVPCARRCVRSRRRSEAKTSSPSPGSEPRTSWKCARPSTGYSNTSSRRRIPPAPWRR